MGRDKEIGECKNCELCLKMLAKWDVFRTGKLIGVIKYPKIELEQSQQLLSV